MKLILTAGDDRLVVETDGSGWTRCYLLSPQGDIYLGANVTKYVLGGLELAVDEPEEVYQDNNRLDDIFGHHARNVLSLFEAHPKNVLCVAEEDTHRLVLCLSDYVDGSGFTLAHVLTLSPFDRARWQEQLAELRSELSAANEKM